ncbi:Poly(A) RNA polymerase gld-4 [Diplonema papillatum]|nr:Poly(A) RNA polymerase gld-4 [Diplonema papillatum]
MSDAPPAMKKFADNESSRRGGRHSRFARDTVPWVPPTIAQPLPKWTGRKYSLSWRDAAAVTADMRAAEETDRQVTTIGEDGMPVLGKPASVSAQLMRVLDSEIYDFMHHMELTEDERSVRRGIAERVEAVTRKLWPESTLEVFGSWATNLCLPSSDIDFTLSGVESSEAQKLSRAMQSDGLTTQVISATKVPLVRITDPTSGIHADISFNMSRAAASAANMKRLVRKYPVARPLIMTLKSILKLGNINELYTGGLSSYSLSLMVIAYLQMAAAQAKPSEEEEEQDNENSEGTAEDEEETSGSEGSEASSAELTGTRSRTSGSSNVSSVENERDLCQGAGQALIGFLETYGLEATGLDFDTIAVSVAQGKCIPKKDSPCGAHSTSSLCLEDPLCFENDVAKGTFRFTDVRMLFSTTLKVLKWYEGCTTLWEQHQRANKTYCMAPPPATPLMAVFGCDPREFDPSWGHPLTWARAPPLPVPQPLPLPHHQPAPLRGFPPTSWPSTVGAPLCFNNGLMGFFGGVQLNDLSTFQFPPPPPPGKPILPGGVIFGAGFPNGPRADVYGRGPKHAHGHQAASVDAAAVLATGASGKNVYVPPSRQRATHEGKRGHKNHHAHSHAPQPLPSNAPARATSTPARSPE